MLGAPLAFALYNVVLKPLLGRLRPARAHRRYEPHRDRRPLPVRADVDRRRRGRRLAGDAALLLYLGLLATLVGYILWNAGLRGLGPTRAVSYTYAISPLAVLIGAAVLDEPLSVYLGLGAVLVIGGIALAQRAFRAREPGAEIGAVAPRGERTLTQRELNRALLARQLLLDRVAFRSRARSSGSAESRINTRRTRTSGCGRASRASAETTSHARSSDARSSRRRSCGRRSTSSHGATSGRLRSRSDGRSASGGCACTSLGRASGSWSGRRES